MAEGIEVVVMERGVAVVAAVVVGVVGMVGMIGVVGEVGEIIVVGAGVALPVATYLAREIAPKYPEVGKTPLVVCHLATAALVLAPK